jgi:hypothetical protein
MKKEMQNIKEKKRKEKNNERDPLSAAWAEFPCFSPTHVWVTQITWPNFPVASCHRLTGPTRRTSLFHLIGSLACGTLRSVSSAPNQNRKAYRTNLTGKLVPTAITPTNSDSTFPHKVWHCAIMAWAPRERHWVHLNRETTAGVDSYVWCRRTFAVGVRKHPWSRCMWWWPHRAWWMKDAGRILRRSLFLVVAHTSPLMGVLAPWFNGMYAPCRTTMLLASFSIERLRNSCAWIAYRLAPVMAPPGRWSRPRMLDGCGKKNRCGSLIPYWTAEIRTRDWVCLINLVRPTLILWRGFDLKCFKSWPSNDYPMATTLYRFDTQQLIWCVQS